MPLKYPLVLGSICAGTVDKIGSHVTKVAINDRVCAGLNNYANGSDPARASHQRYALADEAVVVAVGSTLSFPDAVAANSQTPAATLFKFLGMQYPEEDVKDRGQSLLIWGGSSAMGLLCIRYAKLAGYKVVTTASEHGHALLKEAGADVIFDRNQSSLSAQLEKELPIDFWLNTIAVPETVQQVFTLAEQQRRSTGKDIKIITLCPTGGAAFPKPPEGVTVQFMMFRGKLEENRAHVQWLLEKDGFLERGLRSGTIRGVPAEVVGGLDAVPKALKMMSEGVSAKKLIIDPWM